MTSGESFESNDVEADGIRMEISVPDVVVIAIPENRNGASTFVLLGICITNNTPTPFRFNLYGTLIPELVPPDGQAQQRRLATDEQSANIQSNIPALPGWGNRLAGFLSNLVRPPSRSQTREINYFLVEPRESKSVCLTTRVSWQNNLLQIQIPTSPDDFQAPTSHKNLWSFDAQEPTNYQLRFIYDTECGTRPSSEADTREQERTLQEVGSGQLATPFVNLRLVQPVEPDCSAVEVDGIRFETVIPGGVLTAPKKNAVLKLLYIFKSLLTPPQPPIPGASVRIGIRITNNTLTPLRFNFHCTLIPELVGADGQIPIEGYCISPEGSSESDFPSALPGESITFFPEARLFWIEGKRFGLSFNLGGGGLRYFRHLHLGTYQLRFTYNNRKAVAQTYDQVMKDMKLIEGLWTGMVSTSFVEFCLVQP